MAAKSRLHHEEGNLSVNPQWHHPRCRNRLKPTHLQSNLPNLLRSWSRQHPQRLCRPNPMNCVPNC